MLTKNLQKRIACSQDNKKPAPNNKAGSVFMNIRCF